MTESATNSTKPTIVLASTSIYRANLLKQLGLKFTTARPLFIETHSPDQLPNTIARDFAEAKARSLTDQFTSHLIIGSDQTASLNGHLLTKPGTFDNACEQLKQCSGQSVTFYTGLTLLNTTTGTIHTTVDVTEVSFRQLSDEQIKRYIEREQPLDCCGSFKVEGLGISLFTAVNGKDPNSLIGLPLIDLVSFLRLEGIDIP
ncbi:septum formation inhibitor Maf [Hahella sp. CCB-MM4]|uniref:Maf family protein n=1 Tax=Hahella sp. (strain CCB-MM4) TaxID=1926491 RepID=UPI000B9A3B07|nr:Maf family protein [Hahella sp. CCB-MM4]OZG71304.1 septum formation inhibitor Maf [Hahella sp. CCB-MM4]